MTRPPVTSMVTPVIHDDCGVARNTAEFRDILNSAEPSQRKALPELLTCGGGHVGDETLGLDRGRGDAVDAHAARGEVDGEMPGEHHDAGLGRRVRHRCTTRLPSGGRRHRHDGSPPPLDHAEREGSNRDVRRREVAVDDRAPARRIELRDRLRAPVATREREQHSRRTEGDFGAGSQRVHLVLAGAVCRDADGTSPGGRDRRHHGIDGSLVAPRDDHCGTECGEAACRRGTDAPRTAGDHDHLVAEVRGESLRYHDIYLTLRIVKVAT